MQQRSAELQIWAKQIYVAKLMEKFWMRKRLVRCSSQARTLSLWKDFESNKISCSGSPKRNENVFCYSRYPEKAGHDSRKLALILCHRAVVFIVKGNDLPWFYPDSKKISTSSEEIHSQIVEVKH